MKVIRRSRFETLLKSDDFVTAAVRLMSTIIIAAFALLMLYHYKPVVEAFLAVHPPTSIKTPWFEIAFRALDRVEAKKQDSVSGSEGPFAPLSPEEAEQVKERLNDMGMLLRGRRVLWVDDHPEYQIPEREFLGALGIEIDTAQTSATAYKLYGCNQMRNIPYDLVISDETRDDRKDPSGFSMGKFLYQNDPNVQILFYTGKGSSWYQKPVQDDFPFYPVVAITNRTQDLFNKIFDVLEFKATSSISTPTPAAALCEN